VKLGLGLAGALGVGMAGSEINHSIRENMVGGKLIKFLTWLGLFGLTVAAGTVAANAIMETTDSVKEIYDDVKLNSGKK
jgi:hypothetical protein